ncbi:MAG: thioredoxin family protein [Armatimonadota bacterium]
MKTLEPANTANRFQSLRRWIPVVILIGLASAGLAAQPKQKAQIPKPPSKSQAKPARLPRLVDLGASRCIPCRMMAPILDELSREQKGKLEVVVIDVWEKPELARAYGVRVIPTQIFYDSNGREFYRHEGFISKADILAIFRKRGITLNGQKPAAKRR